MIVDRPDILCYAGAGREAIAVRIEIPWWVWWVNSLLWQRAKDDAEYARRRVTT